MCKYRDYSISLKAVTAIPAFINFIVSKPMALPYVIWAGHLHGLDHGIILFVMYNNSVSHSKAFTRVLRYDNGWEYLP